MAPKQAAIEEAIHCWCHDIPLTDEALAAIDTAIGNLEEGDLRIVVFQNIRREAIQQRGLSAEVVAASLGTSGSYGGGAASGNGKGSASGDHGGAGKGTASVIFRRPAAAKAEGGKGTGSGVLRRPAAVQAEGGKGTDTVIFRRPAAANAEGGKGTGSGVLRRPAAVQAEGGKGGKGGRKGR
jgi:hypothetical protein